VAFQQGSKVRTCGLREYLLKLAWRAALDHTPLNGLFGEAQAMSERRGSLKAARWVQEQLDGDKVVILGDAVNAHPSFSRHALRAMMLAKRDILSPLFSIFNFTYCYPTLLRAFTDDGDMCFQVEILRGMLQGLPTIGRAGRRAVQFFRGCGVRDESARRSGVTCVRVACVPWAHGFTHTCLELGAL
jgi:hypothetical protein